MDEPAIGQSFDEDWSVAAVMVYILNPWPWLAVGVPAAIIAAVNLVAYLQRRRVRTKAPTRP